MTRDIVHENLQAACELVFTADKNTPLYTWVDTKHAGVFYWDLFFTSIMIQVVSFLHRITWCNDLITIKAANE